MLDLTCCGCGAPQYHRLLEAIENEYKRRIESEAEGFQVPPDYLMCHPCAVKMKKIIDKS